ncbi:RNase II stability modulator [Salmonella enterica subsp. enterica serovar Typhimurium]|nr:RNase II stability modulator [Salmonella enterica subsp. enterica serovar Typhimurium]
MLKKMPFLTKNGVNERQGFLFAKPMPAVSFERWYKRYQTKKNALMATIIGRTACADRHSPIFPFSFQINFCIMN